MAALRPHLGRHTPGHPGQIHPRRNRTRRSIQIRRRATGPRGASMATPLTTARRHRTAPIGPQIRPRRATAAHRLPPGAHVPLRRRHLATLPSHHLAKRPTLDPRLRARTCTLANVRQGPVLRNVGRPTPISRTTTRNRHHTRSFRRDHQVSALVGQLACRGHGTTGTTAQRARRCRSAGVPPRPAKDAALATHTGTQPRINSRATALSHRVSRSLDLRSRPPGRMARRLPQPARRERHQPHSRTGAWSVDGLGDAVHR